MKKIILISIMGAFLYNAAIFGITPDAWYTQYVHRKLPEFDQACLRTGLEYSAQRKQPLENRIEDVHENAKLEGRSIEELNETDKASIQAYQVLIDNNITDFKPYARKITTKKVCN